MSRGYAPTFGQSSQPGPRSTLPGQTSSQSCFGISVNHICQKGNSITVEDPVALYISHFDTSHFMLDYNTAGASTQDLKPVPAGTFQCTRGEIDKTGRGLRLRITIPDGTLANDGKTPLTVSDIYDDTFGGNYIQYDAQFADHIQMSVSVMTIQAPAAEPKACPGPAAAAPATNGTAAAMSVNGVYEDGSTAPQRHYMHSRVAGRRAA